jgi:hypothetical protein
MKNVLIVSGHPNLNGSLANATILGEVTAWELFFFLMQYRS